MELTKEQVENLVKEPVTSFTISSGSDKGDNVASDLYRIQVKTKSGSDISLVYKLFPTNHPVQRAYAIEGGIFRRENNFYSTFAPAVQALVSSRSKSGSHLELPIPKFYAGFNDDENDFVCLQDLRPLGFKMPDKYVGLTYPETSLAMKKLAQYHALSYFYLRSQGESIFEREQLFRVYLHKHWAYADPKTNPDKVSEYRQLFNLFYSNTVQLVQTHADPSDRESLVERMKGKNLPDKAYDLVVSTTLGTDDEYFPLLIHGDFWSNNLLYTYDSEGGVKDCKFLDFQYTRRGNIYEDINYFLYCSTAPAFRRQFLHSVLEEYYDSFLTTLTQVNCPPPIGWTRGKFLDQFYDNVLPSFVFLSFALPLQLGQDSEDGSTETEYPDELVSKMKRDPRAIQRLLEVTREMVSLNIL